ncbi:hypothetical protein NA78x_000921 [Anatilimnocola sp. NA78]|uniref:hypothetical protein n=1 Tax=Anatilimnocola sp. NA78 TaxID=3415683 RepID=UPI003CE5BBD3
MNEQSPAELPEPKRLTGQQTYNVVTDIGAGPNLRARDNLYQALAIFVCLVIGASVGYFSMRDQVLGAVAGGFFGVLAGLFGSGVFLMIYRMVRHAKGKHD